MKKIAFRTTITLFALFILPRSLYPQTWGEWVNNQGCYCGKWSAETVSIISRGYGTVAERTASQDQVEYWNKYAGIYADFTLGTGLGAPNNDINEINTFISQAQALAIYSIAMGTDYYGMAVIRPAISFGGFDECKDFSISRCGAFLEADILMNENFYTGWTTDPDDYSRALIQATAVHEIGHTWGAHHVFTLPAFGDSYSCMNYMNDDSIKFITRMDANTVRAAYSAQSHPTVDVGIFPFIYGNSDYAETYTSVLPTTVQPGQNLNISNWLIQNIGGLDAENTTVTFFLSTDTEIAAADYELGTASFGTLTANTEGDQNTALPIPAGIPSDTYYIGAIAYVNLAEDGIIINNSFIIGRPARTQITVTGVPTPTPTPTSQSLILESGDYNGDGTSDIAIFRGTSGLWSVRGVTRVYYGSSSDLPISGDYDGDGTADIGIFRPGSGLWGVRDLTRLYYGSASDIPVPGDYDGDGSCDVGIFRGSSGLWAVDGVTRVYFGASGDQPVPGDYDGDNAREIALFRGSSGMWAIEGFPRVYFGGAGDFVVPGDYYGDGTWKPGIFRPASGMWAITGVTRVYYGGSSDRGVPADYDGDGRDDIAIFRGSSGLWGIKDISRVYFGGAGDIPVTR